MDDFNTLEENCSVSIRCEGCPLVKTRVPVKRTDPVLAVYSRQTAQAQKLYRAHTKRFKHPQI